MPNTITHTARRAATTRIIEFQHPTTLAWQDGQLVSGTLHDFRAVLTGVPAGVYPIGSLHFRLKGSSPEVAGTNAKEVTVLGPVTTQPSTITFTAPGNKTTGGAGFQLVATSTNPAAITFSSADAAVISTTAGGAATIVGVGTVVLTASQPAGNGYAAGSATQSVTVSAPAGPPTYTGVVSRTLPTASPGESEGMVFASDGSQRVEFDKIFNTKGNVAQLQITDLSGGPTVYLSYPDEYVNRPFTFYRTDGQYFTQPFPADGASLSL